MPKFPLTDLTALTKVPVMLCTPTQALAAWKAAGLPHSPADAPVSTARVLGVLAHNLGAEATFALISAIPANLPLPEAEDAARAHIASLTEDDAVEGVAGV